MTREGMEVSIAVAEAVKLCDADCIAAYPITPQTHIVEHLAELVADGELNAAFIPVESEHSAMSVCCGTAGAGARTFTSTSSQGLSLMSEIMFITASLRLPVVMALVDREEGGREALQAKGYPLFALFTASELKAAAKAKSP